MPANTRNIIWCVVSAGFVWCDFKSCNRHDRTSQQVAQLDDVVAVPSISLAGCRSSAVASCGEFIYLLGIIVSRSTLINRRLMRARILSACNLIQRTHTHTHTRTFYFTHVCTPTEPNTDQRALRTCTSIQPMV